MNYLAHLYLSEPNEEAWLGSLLGDFVKGRSTDATARTSPARSPCTGRSTASPMPIPSCCRANRGSAQSGAAMRHHDRHVLRSFPGEELGGIPWRTDRGIHRTIYGILHARHAMLPDRLQAMGAANGAVGLARILRRHRFDPRGAGSHGPAAETRKRLMNSADELVQHYAVLEAISVPSSAGAAIRKGPSPRRCRSISFSALRRSVPVTFQHQVLVLRVAMDETGGERTQWHDLELLRTRVIERGAHDAAGACPCLPVRPEPRCAR